MADAHQKSCRKAHSSQKSAGSPDGAASRHLKQESLHGVPHDSCKHRNSPCACKGPCQAPRDVERVPPLRPGRCDYCAKQLGQVARARHARFCSADCRKAWWTVARNRGAQLYQMLLIWRMHYGRKGTRGAGMIGRISALIDSWVRADKAGGDDHAAK